MQLAHCSVLTVLPKREHGAGRRRAFRRRLDRDAARQSSGWRADRERGAAGGFSIFRIRNPLAQTILRRFARPTISGATTIASFLPSCVAPRIERTISIG
jgi:hypothetical protein